MSLTIICLYIIFGMFIYLFFHYKFLKIFENTLIRSVFTKTKIRNKCGIWSIPGPINIPFVGTKWVFLWKYKMSQIHKAYEGEVIELEKEEFQLNEHCLTAIYRLL